MAAEAPPPGWTLISVLFSTFPLEGALVATLHQAALDLYQRGQATGPVSGDAASGHLVSGRVVNLRRSMALGTLTGPAFEAELETARGSGKVRYLLTRQGLELLGVGPPPAPTASRTWLN
jgi:hypothetical protein